MRSTALQTPLWSATDDDAETRRGVLSRVTRRLTGVDVDAIENLVVAIRVLFFRFSLLNVGVLIVLVVISDAPAAWTAAALVASAGLTAWWTRGFRRSRFPLWSPLVEGAALTVIASTIGDPLRALILYYVALYFRTLYGSGRDAAVLCAAFAASHLASIELSQTLATAGDATLLTSTVLMQIPGFATAVIAMNSLLLAATRTEEDRRRQVVFANAGAAMGAADDPASVATATWNAAQALAGPSGWARAVVALQEHGALRVVAASDDALLGTRIDLDRADAVLAARLERTAMVRVTAAQARLLGLPWEAGTVVPLLIDGALRGVIIIEGFDRSLRDALVTLATQVSLALGRVDAAAAINAREARFHSLLANASDVIGVLDRHGEILYQSEGLTHMLGPAPADVIGHNVMRYVHPDDARAAHDAFAAVAGDAGGTTTIELRVRHADGPWRYLEAVIRNMLDDDTVAGMVINYRDVTERKELEARLRHQAMHDALTGLPNRDLFYDRVDHALEQRRRSGGMVGIVYVDLDNFKMVNDAWGHAAGDEVLVAVAQRLRAAMRDSDTCARLGGDEFGVLLESLSHTDAAYEAGARVLDALGLPVDLDTRSVDVEASAGIVIATGAETVDEIIRNADIAMYRAKGAGKGRYEIFEASMRESVRERVRLRADLERGLAAGEFVAHYQPIVALSSMTVVGVEALVRWHHPQRGLLAPEAFITVAEETGVVVPIGRNILAQACRDVRGWRNRTGAPLRLGVNLSGRELADPELERYVVNVLEDSGLDPHLLSFELTENMLLADVDTTQDTLRALSLLGAGIVLDDFGTGYSSLAYLERYPVDVVKIDKSFVDRLGDVTESPMAGAIIALGHTFDVSVNAEGVERRTQVERLHELGCELAQGRYFASPRPAADISRLLLSGGLLVPTTVTEV